MAAQEKNAETGPGGEPAPFVRVVSDGPTGRHARIELVDGGSVTEIPNVRKATLTLKAGEMNTAELELLVVNGNVSAGLVRLREIVLPPPPRPTVEVVVGPPRRRWHGLRRSDVRVIRWTPAADGLVAEAVLACTTRPRTAVCYRLEEGE